jgi:hypothetical protein
MVLILVSLFSLATICFNYLQQQFYLVKPSMKALAKGKNEEVIIKLLKNLINATQGVIIMTIKLIELS